MAVAFVLQEEAADKVVLTPDMLTDEANLEVAIDLGAVAWPVLHALGAAVFNGSTQADDYDAVLLPHHLPEVARRVLEGTLRRDVGRVLGIRVADETGIDVVLGRLVVN